MLFLIRNYQKRDRTPISKATAVDDSRFEPAQTTGVNMLSCKTVPVDNVITQAVEESPTYQFVPVVRAGLVDRNLKKVASVPN